VRLTVALTVDYEVQAAVCKRVRLLRRITGVTKYFTTGVTWRCIRRFVADSLATRNLLEKALLRRMTGITTGRSTLLLALLCGVLGLVLGGLLRGGCRL
jgi:hypothetical protein